MHKNCEMYDTQKHSFRLQGRRCSLNRFFSQLIKSFHTYIPVFVINILNSMKVFCTAAHRPAPTRYALTLVGHENAQKGASNRTCPNGDCALSNGREEKREEEEKDPLRAWYTTVVKLAVRWQFLTIHMEPISYYPHVIYHRLWKQMASLN